MRPGLVVVGVVLLVVGAALLFVPLIPQASQTVTYQKTSVLGEPHRLFPDRLGRRISRLELEPDDRVPVRNVSDEHVQLRRVHPPGPERHQRYLLLLGAQRRADRGRDPVGTPRFVRDGQAYPDRADLRFGPSGRGGPRPGRRTRATAKTLSGTGGGVAHAERTVPAGHARYPVGGPAEGNPRAARISSGTHVVPMVRGP